MARNMNWALDPRQRRSTSTAPTSPVQKKSTRKSTTKKEEE